MLNSKQAIETDLVMVNESIAELVKVRDVLTNTLTVIAEPGLQTVLSQIGRNREAFMASVRNKAASRITSDAAAPSTALRDEVKAFVSKTKTKSTKTRKLPDGGTIQPLIKAAIRHGQKAGVVRGDITKHVMKVAPTTNAHSLDTALYRMKERGVVTHHDGRYFLNSHAPKLGKPDSTPVTTGTDSAASKTTIKEVGPLLTDAPKVAEPASSRATNAPKPDHIKTSGTADTAKSRYVETGK